jgi:hypothetical protein
MSMLGPRAKGERWGVFKKTTLPMRITGAGPSAPVHSKSQRRRTLHPRAATPARAAAGPNCRRAGEAQVM